MVAYDEDGLELCYDVEGAPVGLSINGKGDISWAPTEADTGKHEFTVHITTPQGGRKSVEVSLEVTKNGFVFAELGGHDGAAGTIDDPFGTIEKGLAALKPSGAKTLIIRGGTWLVNWKWEAGGVSAPTRDARFSAAEPGEIYGYPGEKVIIQRDQKSHGLWLYRSQYVIARDVEFRGANVGERGGAETSGENLVFQRVTVRDSDWNAADNCSGFKLRGVEIVAHRCAAHDNYERKKLGVAWNNANYLMYADDTPPPLVYAIDCDSSGSVAAYKIKHAGPGKFIVHGVRDNGSFYGFGGIDDGLRVRYSTFVDNHIGIHLGISDPNSHTAAGDVVVEHNTVVHPKETAITLQNSYVPTTPIHVERNIFVVNQPFALPEESQWMYAIWIYT
ncbi:MAG TPA: Ig domain-containing protein, partial [Polyangiaceae bacterium]|nr:Ig domain-containing protein [Polyangiaceae bacterium]HPY17869.1 Ig domain-containing protein [Polyangiaceae bacterium]